jgi:hypothetical protein
VCNLGKGARPAPPKKKEGKMHLATSLVGWTSYSAAQVARVVRMVPALIAPVSYASACGLSTVSLLLESLNTLAVSQYHTSGRTADVEPMWALVASSLTRVAAWDSNVILARTSQHDAHEAFAVHFRACMHQCRRWLLAADESSAALVEAEWHVATMLAFVRRGSDPSAAQYTARALCVFLTLLQYHQAQSSTPAAPALEVFFKTAMARTSPDEYCAHTAVWIATHAGFVTEETSARADEAHAALMDLHI